LVSLFQNQQAVKDFNKPREAYNTQLQKGKDLGLDEAGQASKCIPKPYNAYNTEQLFSVTQVLTTLSP
jgi:hypothetical protein